MQIMMTGTTIATNGHTLAEGAVVEVGDEFGQHLIDSGIAETSTEPITRTGKGREEQRRAQIVQDLEIAKRHGDVEAALRLDRINRGEEQPEAGERPAIASELPERARPDQLSGRPPEFSAPGLRAPEGDAPRGRREPGEETPDAAETRRRGTATSESARQTLTR